jgi:hypothetical protein
MPIQHDFLPYFIRLNNDISKVADEAKRNNRNYYWVAELEKSIKNKFIRAEFQDFTKKDKGN